MAPAPAAPAKPAVAKTLFGVAVGTYLAEDRANAEKTRLAAATKLPGRVIASKDGDFSVVLGAFAERANAERMAGDLITRGLVDEARVVPFPNPAYKP
jgi:cell division septation protein DedD